MGIREENERLLFKTKKQQEDIDYLREIICDLKLQVQKLQEKRNKVESEKSL